jgi:hypothetical protein
MNISLTPGQERTLAANRARRAPRNEVMAERLRQDGWTVTPPEADKTPRQETRA